MTKIKLDTTSIRQHNKAVRNMPFVRFSESEVLFNRAASNLLQIRGERVAFELESGELYMMLDLKRGFMVSNKGDGRHVIYCRELSYKIQEMYNNQSVKFEIMEFKGGRWPLQQISQQNIIINNLEVLRFKQKP